jgi:hypothetical protein
MELTAEGVRSSPRRRLGCEFFDATLSVFGSMFAPDHRRAAAERVPPPSRLASPMLWGTDEHLAELFGPDVVERRRDDRALGLQGRKILLEAFHPELVDPLRTREVLEVVLAEIAQRDAVEIVVCEDGRCDWDARICPPWPAAMIRAVRWTPIPW